MSALIDPILAAGFHPLCPYHWVKYGFIATVTLLSIFAFLGIKNRYAQALIAAGVIAVATSPTWAPTLMKSSPAPAPQINLSEVVSISPQTNSSPNETRCPQALGPQELLFALGSSTETTVSCYVINMTEGSSTIIEAPLELGNAKSLHLHWDEKRDLIFAIAGTASNAVDLYQIDPDSPSFEFITTLMKNAEPACSVLIENALFTSKAGTDSLIFAEYDLNMDHVTLSAIRDSEQAKIMRPELVHCADGKTVSEFTYEKLPDHWDLTSKPARGGTLNGTYASIFDQEHGSHQIIRLHGDRSIEPVTETLFPIQALDVVSIDRSSDK